MMRGVAKVIRAQYPISQSEITTSPRPTHALDDLGKSVTMTNTCSVELLWLKTKVRYSPADDRAMPKQLMDLVDVHVHPPTKEFLIEAGGSQVKAAAKKSGHTLEPKTIDQILDENSSASVNKIALFAWDAETTSHRPRVAVYPPERRVLSQPPECRSNVNLRTPVSDIRRSFVSLKPVISIHPSLALWGKAACSGDRVECCTIWLVNHQRGGLFAPASILGPTSLS